MFPDFTISIVMQHSVILYLFFADLINGLMECNVLVFHYSNDSMQSLNMHVFKHCNYPERPIVLTKVYKRSQYMLFQSLYAFIYISFAFNKGNIYQFKHNIYMSIFFSNPGV